MRLRRLTGLERHKLEAELKELKEKIDYFKRILADENLSASGYQGRAARNQSEVQYALPHAASPPPPKISMSKTSSLRKTWLLR